MRCEFSSSSILYLCELSKLSCPPLGTVSANGVPLRSYNLTAVNGVLHLTADVIPEYDLGTDPTTISNPLLGQTEAPQLARVSFFGDKVADVPAISGLYETPDRDPFLDFIPSPETGSVEQPGGVDGASDRAPGDPESQLPPVPSFHEYIESFRLSSVPPAENNIHTVHPGDDRATQEGKPSTDLKQGSKSPELHHPGGTSPHEATRSQTVQPLSQGLFSFLEMLDKTSEGEREDQTSTSDQDVSPQTVGDDSITTTGDSTSVTEALQTESIYQGVNEEGNIVSAVNAVRNDGFSHLPAGERPLPQHSHGDRRNCSSTAHFDVTYTAVSNDRRRVSTQGIYTGAQTLYDFQL